MSGEAESEFRAQVREHLAALTQPLVAVLLQLIAHPYPAEVETLDFELSGDGFTSGFPLRAFFLDADDCEVFEFVESQARYPAPVDPGLLRIERVYPRELEQRAMAADPALDPWALAAQECMCWFAACWSEAGGAAFPRRASLAQHDAAEELNLLTGQMQARHGGAA